MAYFGANVDSLERNKEFADSLSLDYPLLSDADKTAASAYGVLGVLGVASRTTFYVGADGKILFVDRDVSTSSHGADVAKKLGELGVKKRGPSPP